MLTGGIAALACPLFAFAGNDDSLKARAARRGIRFGSETTSKELRSSPQTAQALIDDCAIIVPGVEMKWGMTEKHRGRPSYCNADFIAAFAARHGMALRGHTALWYKNLPPWAPDALTQPGSHDLILRRVRDVIGHFRGRVAEWDVVNEVLEPADHLPGALRNWPPFAHGDPGYIADCFHAAHDADPAALLFYNDYGFEYLSEGENKRRAAALNLIEGLKARNAPIHGLGVQCHLKVGNNFDPAVFRRFLADVAAIGMRISLTELDVDDQRLPANLIERDRQVADHARRFLDTALDEASVKTLLTWGISDRETWLDADRPRTDGLKHRALPLDINFQRKPLWNAIAACLEKAPVRS